jgi:hypothetical protein
MSTTGRAAQRTFRGVLKAFIAAERKQQGASSDLFQLAKRVGNLEDFEGECEIAEAWYLSDAAGQDKVQHLPRKYIQAKSDIRGGFKAGLDLTKIKSYHQMKKLKSMANKADTIPASDTTDDEVTVLDATPSEEEQAPVATVRESDGVIVLSADGSERKSRGERPPRIRSLRDGPQPRDVTTVEEALENGDVVDSKSNLIIPEDMAHLVVLLSRVDEVTRSRFIKRWTKDCQNALSQAGQRRKGGRQHAAS